MTMSVLCIPPTNVVVDNNGHHDMTRLQKENQVHLLLKYQTLNEELLFYQTLNLLIGHNLCPVSNCKISHLVFNHSKTRLVFRPQYIGKAN